MSEEATEQVSTLIANIKRDQDSVKRIESDENEMVSKIAKDDKKISTSVRGKPKSGRFWKSQKEKFSSINKTKGLKQDFVKKTALRLELKRTKELSKQLLEQQKQKEADRKERRRQNIKKSEENRRKAEVVQVITNTAKLKRMKKKQLRFIQKRDTNKEIEANK